MVSVSFLFLEALFNLCYGFHRDPTVRIGQGVVRGLKVRTVLLPEALGSEDVLVQEHFLGVPYAQPPVGKLRFSPPQAIPDNSKRTIDARSRGKVCIQSVGNPLSTNSSESPGDDDISEDCLTLDIIRPRTVNTSRKLPVLVWIHGGGFNSGTSRMYNGTDLIAQSVAINKPIIYVAINYRLNVFGFLASEDIGTVLKERNDVVLNAGLHDQRFALKWIQRNIEAFGGDPDQVTVAGESAGGISIGAHLLAEHWTPRRLFKAAILQSGAASGYPLLPPSKYQVAYEHLLDRVGCGSMDTTASKRIDCLRSVPAHVLVAAQQPISLERALNHHAKVHIPFGVAQDDDFYHERPSISLAAGQIATVPTIIGTNLDEGTALSSTDFKSENDLRYYLEHTWMFEPSPNASQILGDLLELYPDDPSLGSPYVNESSPSGLDPNDRLFEPRQSNQFKRASSFMGDTVFEGGRRAQLKAHLAGTAKRFKSHNMDMNTFYGGDREAPPIWNYHFRQPFENPPLPKYYGIHHALELRFLFGGGIRLAGTESAEVSRIMMRAWIQFVNNLDPNGPGLPLWPRYTSAEKETLQIRAGNMTIIKDDYRQKAIQFVTENEEWNFVTSR